MLGLIWMFFKANHRYGWRWRTKKQLKNFLDHEELNDLLQQILEQAEPKQRSIFLTPWLMVKRGLLMQ